MMHDPAASEQREFSDTAANGPFRRAVKALTCDMRPSESYRADPPWTALYRPTRCVRVAGGGSPRVGCSLSP